MTVKQKYYKSKDATLIPSNLVCKSVLQKKPDPLNKRFRGSYNATCFC